MHHKTDAKAAPAQPKAPGLLLTAGRAGKTKQAAQATLLQQNTAAAARNALVVEKQRLEMVARSLGLSRKAALLLVNAYFTSQPPQP